MPRISPGLLRAAHRLSPHLATLLPACRDLASARNELRWIREHAHHLLLLSSSTASSSSSSSSSSSPLSTTITTTTRHHRYHHDNAEEKDRIVSRLCRRRAAGTPLQYVLGSAPFGPLDLRCRPGVLIPRPETEAWVTHLAEKRLGVVAGDGEGGEELRVLDVCSGSGCVALLLRALLLRERGRGRWGGGGGGGGGVRIRGLDLEPRAVALARENRKRNWRRIGGGGGGGGGGLSEEGGEEVVFERADVFREEWVERLVGASSPSSSSADEDEDDGSSISPEGKRKGAIDVLVSNPPYISARGFERDTARSVRNFEPRRALVPSFYDDDAAVAAAMIARYGCAPEDVFYARLLEVADALRPSIAAFEVGDLDQAVRVVRMAAPEMWDEVEIWRDWPDVRPGEEEARVVRVEGRGDVPVKGSGHGRVVFLRRRV
ncbi:S-adenosyl-L-methionine-dependent methyltransferase [Biscogniauxia mediterranea]|nr:S-adenosyl-L-methionine-dependent methyltransferase [Biscogniauxia mediterranea]